MSVFVVDIESDGPVPGIYNMLEFGAVMIKDNNSTNPDERFESFYGQMRPITDNYVDAAVKVTGLTRDIVNEYPDPEHTMQDFAIWLNMVNQKGRPMFYSDNNGFDWQFINYYFYKFYGQNPFGHSSSNIGSLYKGMERSIYRNFKHLRKTKHTHNPVDDAKGNAEALIEMKRMGLRINI